MNVCFKDLIGTNCIVCERRRLNPAIRHIKNDTMYKEYGIYPYIRVFRRKNCHIYIDNVSAGLTVKIKATNNKIYCWINNQIMSVGEYKSPLTTDLEPIETAALNRYFYG